MNDSVFVNYRDYNYINALIFRNLYRIPEDIDAIVGIPRSGMITATMIAEYKSIQVTDVFSFINGTPTVSVNTHGSLSKQFKSKGIKKILLVDDCMGFGTTMRNTVDLIKRIKPDVDIITFVVFAEPYSTDKVDIYCEVMRYQFMPYSILKRGMQYACVDMDGVLTEDVPYEYNTDDDRYRNFLLNQRPMFTPETPIYKIVTGRLVKHADVTKEWLRKHNIQYNQLIMLDCPNNARRAEINVGEYKGMEYRKCDAELFIESDLNEARAIKRVSNKPVFCTQICEMI